MNKLAGFAIILVGAGITLAFAAGEGQTPQQPQGKPQKQARPAPELVTLDQRFSYTLGLNLGQSLRRGETSVDTEAFIRGFLDGLEGREPALTPEQIRKTQDEYGEREAERRGALSSELARRKLAAAKTFLAENKEREGVQVLPCGVQYRVLRAGTGERPELEDLVVVHYRGTLLDGYEFDNSYKRFKPATFALTDVVVGWRHALEHMAVGAKWEVWIPPGLAYGPQGRGDRIGPNELLIFELELLEIK
ncbi:MAG: FKBP-type peptidyl-prolyl cis-trans isomerase N-terminal domain-containing protein [Candidatus Brocadiaceae bacterium]